MDRKLYLQYRKDYMLTGEIHGLMLYEYYKDHNQIKKYDVNFDDFYRLFRQYTSTFHGNMDMVNLMRKIIIYLDKKFEIVILKDQENKILNVY